MSSFVYGSFLDVNIAFSVPASSENNGLFSYTTISFIWKPVKKWYGKLFSLVTSDVRLFGHTEEEGLVDIV